MARPPAEQPVSKTVSAAPKLYFSVNVWRIASMIRLPRKYIFLPLTSIGSSAFPENELPSQYAMCTRLKLQ